MFDNLTNRSSRTFFKKFIFCVYGRPEKDGVMSGLFFEKKDMKDITENITLAAQSSFDRECNIFQSQKSEGRAPKRGSLLYLSLVGCFARALHFFLKSKTA